MPITAEQLLPFLLTAVLLTATPGPDNLMVLGGVLTLQAAVLFGALGWFAGGMGQWLQRRPCVGLWLDRLAGVVFVSLGLRMAISR